MMKKSIFLKILLAALCIGLLAGSSISATLSQTDGAAEKYKVRAFFPSLEMARKAVISFEALESVYEDGYLLMALTPVEITDLSDLGFRIEVVSAYDKSEHQVSDAAVLDAQAASIPGYICYRTVEETFSSAQAIAANNPTLASWNDVGNSWEKSAGLGGYDMMVLKLTNSNIGGTKPKLFMMGAIHAREYATAELVTRFAEDLIDNYGIDADATWILDYHELHILLIANPDGRKKAESGLSWRKNTNQNYCGATSNYRGADLNRNFTYTWGCCNGSSGYQCDETYRGPSAASEPEVQAIQAYVRSQFADNRGPGVNDPAPDDTSGIFLDIHSHGRLVLWPWGHTSSTAPNGTQMQTLGRKFAYWNSHTPQQSIGLYPTDGTSYDVSYGELGVASFIFELGTAFFQSCSYFNSPLLPTNMPALKYAAKVLRTPYLTPAGPDTYNPALSSGSSEPGVPPGTNVTLTATVDDTRYNNSNGTEGTQNINAARYFVDTPPWNAGTAVTMSASDGSFNTKTEGAQATIDTTGWSQGQHIVFVQGRDTSGQWGAVSAIFLYISGQATLNADFTFTATDLTVNFTDTSSAGANPITGWAWDFGDGGTSSQQNPTHTYGAAGTFTVRLTVTDSGGGTDSATKNVTVPPQVNYCASAGQTYSDEWIAQVTVGGLSNPSGAAGYTDFTSQTVNLSKGQAASVSLSPGFSGSTYNEFWKIWIDLNRDGTFGAGEELFSNSGTGTVTGSLTVPTSALTGSTRMRVSMKYNAAPGACETFQYGEVEDYTANITDGGPVTQYDLTVNTVGQGTVALDPSGGRYDEGTTVTLTANPATDWTFSSWSGDLTGSGNPATIVMNANKTVTATFISGPDPDSCEGNCGGQAPGGCWCDSQCSFYGDCCADKTAVCGP